ncbi:hypothetical protein CEXT_103561 [Caerostris extrusa]|uniref:Uncharacterized protein n=1 Tax=Caerostris extrusa TaxID=172846 RepID=A0AAV4QZV2_CAEEX|nr:hypothetical protein CEXT_103561 [Caerostris extrusa]
MERNLHEKILNYPEDPRMVPPLWDTVCHDLKRYCALDVIFFKSKKSVCNLWKDERNLFMKDFKSPLNPQGCCRPVVSGGHTVSEGDRSSYSKGKKKRLQFVEKDGKKSFMKRF